MLAFSPPIYNSPSHRHSPWKFFQPPPLIYYQTFSPLPPFIAIPFYSGLESSCTCFFGAVPQLFKLNNARQYSTCSLGTFDDGCKDLITVYVVNLLPICVSLQLKDSITVPSFPSLQVSYLQLVFLLLNTWHLGNTTS